MTATGAGTPAHAQQHSLEDAGADDGHCPGRRAPGAAGAPESDARGSDARGSDATESHTAEAGPAEAAAAELGARDALPRLLKVFGGIVAPTTLLTGLLFYFGRSRSSGYYRYFRVNSTVLDLTTNDYLFSGVDGLFVPISVTCLAALLLIWLHRLLLTRVPEEARRRGVRVLVPVAAVTGAVLLTLAFADLFTEGDVFGANSPTGGVFLALGAVLLVYAVRLLRVTLPGPATPGRRRSAPTGMTEWGAAFLLVSIGLFWAADGYAFTVGTGGAMTLHRALPTTVPAAVLYSEQSLSLAVPGVSEARCTDPEAAFRFRYDGLRLVRQAGDHYLLLPATWNRDDGVAVLIPRSSTVRLEFARPGGPARSC